VVGSPAYDTIETPSGRAEDVLGGAATYFSCAASFFGPVRLVGPVGNDFRDEDRALLRDRAVDLEGLEQRPGDTFRWSVRYGEDLKATTLDTRLNVFGNYLPEIPAAYRDSRFAFLANAAPSVQLRALEQLPSEAFTVMDSMDLWIEKEREDLGRVLRRVDMVIVNDEEARAITGEKSLIKAGRELLNFGPSFVMVKKGEHGAFLWSRGFFFAAPAYPVDTVVDPTGAGDAFAGGVMGYLANAGIADEQHLRRAMIYGLVLASFCVEAFSLEGLEGIDRGDVDARYQEFLRFTAHPS
jgi:sugar/nucleoside kinase (ribokinase family)